MAEESTTHNLPPVARRVLIALDASAEAAHAADYGLKLAGALSAEVILASVVQVAVAASEAYPGAYPIVEDPVEEEIETSLADAAPEVLQRGLLDSWQEAANRRGVAAQTVVAYGSAIPTLLEIAAEQQADLIVCGTHARRGIRRAVLGSVAESLARQAPCPVLLVRRVDGSPG